MEKDFSSISPSAASLILMKGHTSIPFARRAAELISYPKPFVPDFENRDLLYWSRVLHFESRYRAIDALLGELEVDNVLELSSGYSFRGLDRSAVRKGLYIDSDLPEVIEKKRAMLEAIGAREGPGRLELLPLNALEEGALGAAAERFPPGPIAVVNEGLLMYLDPEEKARLARGIRGLLEARGGWWITSDVYIRVPVPAAPATSKGGAKDDDDFRQRHRVEENKFASFEEARAFFESAGFTVDREEDPDPRSLSAFPYLAACLDPAAPRPSGRGGRMQSTWRLRLAEDQ